MVRMVKLTWGCAGTYWVEVENGGPVMGMASLTWTVEGH